MIPSLVAGEVRRSLVEYLTTTFALTDDDVRDALTDFLQGSDGIFRGPYLRVKTPFESAGEEWTSPLGWLPDGFVPYAHQATAFERLSTLNGEAEPTIVTTGTGSGKTECFMYPVLDHCARAAAKNEKGIKALILYPMNALASDQAGRLAETINNDPLLAGIRAGMYVGEAGRHTSMGPDHLIDKRDVLRADPPDILLTNYKMLDFLLLRREDRDLWADNTADTLRYIVLDEFHTYDGAQGTDVAMLLRRLGRTLGMADGDRPLGAAVPVATSATLGSGADAAADMCDFASRVFGRPIDTDAIIGEQLQSVEDACLPINYLLPTPNPNDLVGIDDTEALIAAFCEDTDLEPLEPGDLVALGERLLAHPLTRSVLEAGGSRPRSWADAVAEINKRTQDWGREHMRNPVVVEEALAKFLALLSIARRNVGGRERPLFSLQVQLWIREVSRVLRSVGPTAGFRWRDSALGDRTLDDNELDGNTPDLELPATYCRRCGASGWMAMRSPLSTKLRTGPATIYQAAVNHSPEIVTLLRANPNVPGVVHLNPTNHELEPAPTDDSVPVLVTTTEDDAKNSVCPACGEREAIRFLGTAVASLASVSLSTLFGSDQVDNDQRKLIAFTDSVQDASHRAAFFSGRTYRFNLRSLMAGAVRDAGEIRLSDLGTLVEHSAADARDRHGLVPPDLTRHPAVRTVWTDSSSEEGRFLLGQRLAFEAHLEFGLRSRVGRTIELVGATAAETTIDDRDHIVELLAEKLENELGSVDDATLTALPTYLQGLVERLRLRGGVMHPHFLDKYLTDNGRLWHIWGGREDGAPPFTPDQSRPVFFTTAPKSDFDSVTAVGATPTWLVDWAQRTLGIERSDAAALNRAALDLLATDDGPLGATSTGATRIYGIRPEAIRLVDVADGQQSLLGCDTCGARHAAPPDRTNRWEGTNCLRYRCPGHFELLPPQDDHYYRSLYRTGRPRRVVTGEHTGMLGRTEREDLETAFKTGDAADAPNVITATPTLEMGIDIGDLSAVMLTGVPPKPANYIQRVGRAGRATGNALVATFVQGDTHGLYYLSQPDAMINGEVRAPNCYLDALETLKRQYHAYLFDRVADFTIGGEGITRKIGDVVNRGLEPDGILRRVIDASTTDPVHIDTFLQLFGDTITDETQALLRDHAGAGIELAVKQAVEVWKADQRELANRRDRLNRAIANLEDKDRTDLEDELLRDLRGQRSSVARLLADHRDDYSLSGLERLGLLPNYTLIDDATTLEVTMWGLNADGDHDVERYEYQRSGALAVQEFAPGNSFYAGGHRHVIDALEIGTADQPLFEEWRICPDCGHAEIVNDTVGACPRCGAAAFADVGAKHQLLRLRTARAASSEEAARVYDETDERRRERYSVVTTVDVDPAHVSGAWQLHERAFGAEFCRYTDIRRINFGRSDRPGERTPVAGRDINAAKFTVCSECGAERDARKRRNDDDTDQPHHHQGWCKVRSGSKRPDWQKLALHHELTTDAVRMLLPISMFEVEERLASFKGALLLGLRNDFGGDPDHLDVLPAELPNRGGQGRYRFLVLFDRVPGGTGYLDRLADPDRVKAILEGAREQIARCRCVNEARQACHRCLLGVVDRHEYELVSRDLALNLLDDLLQAWDVDDTITTVAESDIGKVEESELERRFRVALQAWADTRPDVTMNRAASHNGRDSWEIRIGEGNQLKRYRLDEQEGLGTSPATTPDFVFRRVDAAGTDVAVYLDGFQFHASEEHKNIAGDAAKRRGIRNAGHWVWCLAWDDVEAFHTAVTEDPPRIPKFAPYLTGTAKNTAKQRHSRRSVDERIDFDTLDANQMNLLLEYLQRPEDGHWRDLARSALTGIAGADSPQQVQPESIGGVVQAAADALDPPRAAGSGPLVASWIDDHDLRIGAVLDVENPDAERWTAFCVLQDTDAHYAEVDTHRPRWRSWLRWSNLLQFLDPHGSAPSTWIAASSESRDLALEDLWIQSDTAEIAAKAEPVAVLSDRMEEELKFVDPNVAELVRTALAAGAPDFVAGAEIEGLLIEAAWEDARVGIALPGQQVEVDGWAIHPPEIWAADELIGHLKGTP